MVVITTKRMAHHSSATAYDGILKRNSRTELTTTTTNPRNVHVEYGSRRGRTAEKQEPRAESYGGSSPNYAQMLQVTLSDDGVNQAGETHLGKIGYIESSD